MPRAPKYAPKALDDAIKAVQDGMSVNAASNQYKVPRTTLRDRLKKGDTIVKEGAPQILPQCVEERGALMIDFLAKWRLPLTHFQFRRIMQSIPNEINSKHPRWPENIPGIYVSSPTDFTFMVLICGGT